MENQGHSPDRPGLLPPPPGFENRPRALSQPTDEETRSGPSAAALALAAQCGIFPFPPPRDATPSLSSASSSPSSGFSFLELEQELENMEVTNVTLKGHHHGQMVALMKKKYQDILDFTKMKNTKVLHLDWICGNPEDPIKFEGAGHDGLSAEDRRLAESVARSTMKITYGIDKWDERMTWNKSEFYGHWLNDDKGQRHHFIEIQVKRVSGANDEALKALGVHPEYIWLSLHDPNAEPIPAVPVPRLMSTPRPSRKLPPTPADIAAASMNKTAAEPASQGMNLETPTCSEDKGKAKSAAPTNTGVTNTASTTVIASSENAREAPIIVSSDSARRPAVGITLSPQAPSSVEVAPTAIPRTSPLHATGNIPSDDSTDTAPEPDDDGNDSDSTIAESDSENNFQPAIIATRPRTDAEIRAFYRRLHAAQAAAKRDELKRIFSFLEDPAFIERKNKSFVYLVRVVAIPEGSGGTVNVFTGPRLEDRRATLLATGAWVVPPLEERVRHRDEHKRFYKHKGAKPGKYEGLPRPMFQHAMPLDKTDWTFHIPARYYGPPVPLWIQPVDPTLEDVYWMVWQLLSGKQFLGLQQGTGFGVYRGGPSGNADLLAECPFKSPSTEAVYHAACYGRGKER